jgi:putative acetyltransferase
VAVVADDGYHVALARSEAAEIRWTSVLLSMQRDGVLVRREVAADVRTVRAIHVAAFRRDGDTEPPEARLLDELRQCDGWLPRLSLVAEIDGVVVGHAVCTRGTVSEVAVLGLGPIAVEPVRQGVGIGSALMHAIIGAADSLDEPLIALLGAPSYYARFGFVPSVNHAIEPPDPSWGVYFQVRTLSAIVAPIGGAFEYAAPFNNM